MITLAEIQAAAERLTPHEKRCLALYLGQPQLPAAPTPADLSQGDLQVEKMRQVFQAVRFDDPDGPATSPKDWNVLREGE